MDVAFATSCEGEHKTNGASLHLRLRRPLPGLVTSIRFAFRGAAPLPPGLGRIGLWFRRGLVVEFLPDRRIRGLRRFLAGGFGKGPARAGRGLPVAGAAARPLTLPLRLAGSEFLLPFLPEAF